jgi:uncharacterized protein (TIGR03545 family)
MIRKKAFVVLGVFGGLFCGFYFFFLNGIIESRLIASLEKIFQSSVEINKTSIQWSPLRIAINDLNVIDSSRSDRNYLDIDYLAFSIDLFELLNRRLIIDTVEIIGLDSNTPRKIDKKEKISEEILSKKNKSSESIAVNKDERILENTSSNEDIKEEKSASDLSQAKESIESLLDQTELSSKEKIKQIQEQFNTDKQTIEAIVSLENEQKQYDEITIAVEKIKASFQESTLEDVVGIKTELQRLKRNAFDLKTSVSNKKTQLHDVYKNQKNQISGLDTYYKQDYERIKKTFKFSTYSSNNLSDTLLNSTLSHTLETYIKWMTFATRVIKNLTKTTPDSKSNNDLEGIYFNFDTPLSLPRLWIKHSAFSSKLNGMTGSLSNLSSNPKLTGKPIEILYEDPSKKISAIFELNDSKNALIQTYNLDLKPSKLNSFLIISQQNQAVRLHSATQEVTATIINQDSGLTGTILSSVSNISVTANNIESVSLPGLVYQVLKNSPDVLITTKLSGRLVAPKLAVSSNLDLNVKNRFNSIIAQQKQQRLTQLNKALKSRLQKDKTKLIAQMSKQKSSNLKRFDADEGKINQMIETIELLDKDSDQLREKLKKVAFDKLQQQKNEAQKILQQQAQEKFNQEKEKLLKNFKF